MQRNKMISYVINHRTDPITSENIPIASIAIQSRFEDIVDSSDGQAKRIYTAATSGYDKTIIIWKHKYFIISDESNEASGLPSFQCDKVQQIDHKSIAMSIRFSPIDDILAVGDTKGEIVLYKFSRQEMQTVLEGSEEIEAILQSEMGNSAPSTSYEDTRDVLQNLVSMPCFQDLLDVAESEMQTMLSENNDSPNHLWSYLNTLKEHKADILDVSWSIDGKYIVSGSVDKSIIIWNVAQNCLLLKIDDSKGFVQGVAWDPLNRYIATLSADLNLRIYEIDISEAKVLAKLHYKKHYIKGDDNQHLFYGYNARSHSRKLCFSPGGEFLLVPNAQINLNQLDKDKGENEYATVVFKRNKFKKPFFYLPNNEFATAVQCCPQLFTLGKANNEIVQKIGFPYRIVYAISSETKTFIYDSLNSTPGGFIQHNEQGIVTDLSWSADGRLLFISNDRGYCNILTLLPNELGEPYNGPLFFEKDTEPILQSNEVDPSVAKKQKSITHYFPVDRVVPGVNVAKKKVKRKIQTKLGDYFKKRKNDEQKNNAVTEMSEKITENVSLKRKKVHPPSNAKAVEIIELSEDEVEIAETSNLVIDIKEETSVKRESEGIKIEVEDGVKNEKQEITVREEKDCKNFADVKTNVADIKTGKQEVSKQSDTKVKSETRSVDEVSVIAFVKDEGVGGKVSKFEKQVNYVGEVIDISDSSDDYIIIED